MDAGNLKGEEPLLTDNESAVVSVPLVVVELPNVNAGTGFAALVADEISEPDAETEVEVSVAFFSTYPYQHLFS